MVNKTADVKTNLNFFIDEAGGPRVLSVSLKAVTNHERLRNTLLGHSRSFSSDFQTVTHKCKSIVSVIKCALLLASIFKLSQRDR